MPRISKKAEEEKRELYRKAFDDARKDLQETMQFDVEERAKVLCEQRLKDMLSVVDWNNIASIDRNFFYLGKEKATDIQLNNLKAEAEFLEQSHIWKLLYETPKSLAHEAMFIKSESLDDLRKGKSMLYTLDSQRKVVDILRNYTRKQ